MLKGKRSFRRKVSGRQANLGEFVGKTVCITDSKEIEWLGEILKLRTEEDEEDSVIVKLSYGHIVFWESDIHNIVMYENTKKEAI